MQHTLVAVFDNRTDAQNAMNELLSSGFSRQDVRLSNADPTGQTDSLTGREDEIGESGTGIGASIKNFFHDLFGSDNAEHASRYEGAVTRGHHVLTLTADSLPEVERAADIVERYGPTDIDEQASGFGEVPSGTGAMRMGSSSGMSSTPMSAQSGAAGSSGLGSGSGMGAATGASAGAAAGGSAQSLENAGDRKLYQQQSLNQAEPMGGTYQEPMGKSGLGATGGTSLQGSTLQENSIQGSSLEGTQSSGLSSSGSLQGSSLEGSAFTGSQQRAGAGTGSSMGGTQQRSGVRIFSRGEQGMDDDSYYRSHFSSTYGAGSESYDDYLPAYSYGSEMRRTYAGRNWDEVESDLRSGWESRTGDKIEATWERMKAAVRRGWDRITPDDDDDSYYRSHFTSTYGSTGASYDDYLPAYRYGSEMRRSGSYSGRNWDDVESDLRTGWETRAGNRIEAAWDRMKDAVRRGWDRITPDDDDDYYRSHYSSTYASTGKTFSDYAPAYSYGSEMARSELYRNRPWDDVETDLRSDWETRRASSTGSTHSTWENMKDAIKRGWERLTRDDDDDEYYRTHWSNTYGTTGSSYDEYRPAYSYGSQMRRDPRYSGRQWDEVESDLRMDWETRHPGEPSAWEKMKAAVRHGWDRMTH